MDTQGSARKESDSFGWPLHRESERNMSVPEGERESLMESLTRIGREGKKKQKNKNKLTENNF